MGRTPRKLAQIFGIAMAVMGCTAPVTESDNGSVTNIYWSDGDSGRLDGVAFRLAYVDAPETRSIRARGGAQCEAERAREFEAKAFMVELTDDAEIRVTARDGVDRYDREVVHLSVDGTDLAQSGVAAGHLAPWPHRGRRVLGPKPRWCGVS